MSRRQQIKNKVTHYATEWENGNNRANSTLCAWILKAYDQSNQFGKEMDALHRNVTSALEAERVSLGSVRGTLYKFNGRNGNLKAGIEHYQTGTTVELELREAHVSTVLELMQSEVLVRGVLYRDPITNIVTRVKVKDVEKVKPKKLPRPAHEVQGILGTDWLNGLDPVEIVRRERGA